MKLKIKNSRYFITLKSPVNKLGKVLRIMFGNKLYELINEAGTINIVSMVNIKDFTNDFFTLP